MNSTSCRIAVVGSINADLVVRVDRHPQPGETLLGSGGAVTAGGKGANQAVAAAYNGATVALIGAVGTDAYAGPALHYVHDSGIDISGVTSVDTTTGLAVIVVDERGENSIVVVPGANATVDAAAVATQADTIASADIVLLQGEIPPSGFHQALTHARGRVVINLAPVINIDPTDLLRADPLIVNEHEAALVLEMISEQPPHSSSPTELVQSLLDCGFASVVLTLGSEGALVGESTSAHKISTIAAEKVRAVDTTGAGDAFAGALVSALGDGHDLIESARRANAFAAHTVTKPGAQSSYR